MTASDERGGRGTEAEPPFSFPPGPPSSLVHHDRPREAGITLSLSSLRLLPPASSLHSLFPLYPLLPLPSTLGIPELKEEIFHSFRINSDVYMDLYPAKRSNRNLIDDELNAIGIHVCVDNIHFPSDRNIGTSRSLFHTSPPDTQHEVENLRFFGGKCPGLFGVLPYKTIVIVVFAFSNGDLYEKREGCERTCNVQATSRTAFIVTVVVVFVEAFE